MVAKIPLKKGLKPPFCHMFRAATGKDVDLLLGPQPTTLATITIREELPGLNAPSVVLYGG